jgi:serine protease
LAAPTVNADGADWLSAAIEGTALRIFVNRDALPTDSPTGTVSLSSNGGSMIVTVTAEASAASPADIGPVIVALRMVPSRDIVATTSAHVGNGYRFAFENVPPGDYEIVASTDRDGDGEFCELGDECGAYPERAAPISIAVFGGDVVRARDFTLALVVDAS